MQQAQPLVSVIIPVYNSRKRLAACLDHVAAMDYPNLEVIIVDDCSTDGSLEICRTYEKKVPYFHVITKKNEGVSAARNRGIKKAHGKYIQFVDSDDLVKKEAASLMVKRMEEDKSDVVIAGYYDEKAGKDHLPKAAVYADQTAFIKDFPKLFSSYFLHVPWNKLYRREVIEKGFPTDLDKGEDLVFNLHVFERFPNPSINIIILKPEVCRFDSARMPWRLKTGFGAKWKHFTEDAEEKRRLFLMYFISIP